MVVNEQAARDLAQHFRARRPAKVTGLLPEPASVLDAATLRHRLPSASRVALHAYTGARIDQRVLPPARAADAFSAARENDARPTLFAYGLDRPCPELVDLRHALGVGAAHRHASYAATWSTPGSGVGFHADIMDVVLIQLAGTRSWRVWHPEELSQRERVDLARGVPNDWSNGRTHAAHERTAHLACELAPGDALVLPALHPHDGVTKSASDSLCLTLGWFAYTPFALHDALDVGPLGPVDPDDAFWSTPLTEPHHGLDGLDALVDHYVAHVSERFIASSARLSAETIAAKLHHLFSFPPWAS